MVHLTGRRSSCGIDRFVKLTNPGVERSTDEETRGNDRDLGFSDLLVKYRRGTPPVIDASRRELETLLDTARYGLAGARIEAQVEPLVDPLQPDGAPTRFRVTLARSSQDPVTLPPEVKIECYPLTLKAAAALRVAISEGVPMVVFEPLSFEALTSFYAFRLRVARAKLELTCGFVLNLPLLGAPVDRQKRLLLSLLRNREQLLKYLLMLLSDDEETARRLIDAFDGDQHNHHADGREGGFGFPLLEPLLQALDRQRPRLDQIARLIDDLRQSPDGKLLLSEEFLSIWEPIWATRKRIG